MHLIFKKLNPLNYQASRRVVTLMSGTMVAQVIPVAISPILTRIYSPDEFGTLAIYLAILAIVSVLATMRYEMAILQPKKDEDAKALLHLCLVICFVLSLSLFVIVAAYSNLNPGWFDTPSLDLLLYVLPISFLLNGFLLSIRYWFLRQNLYGKMTVVALVKSGGTGVGQTTAGLGQVHNGLIYGQILGQFFASIYMVIVVIKTNKSLFRFCSWKSLRLQASAYANIPKYSVIGALADSLASQLPVLTINKIFGSGVTGYFSLTSRVLNLPLAALSGAISQVLFKKVADSSLTNPERIKPLLIKLHLALSGLMLPFIALFLIWGGSIFTLVFGEAWRQAGDMASIIVFAVAVRFSISPLSTVLAMQQNVRLGASWQLIYVITLAITFFIFRDASIQALLVAFVCHEVVLYYFYFFLILKGADKLVEEKNQCVG